MHYKRYSLHLGPNGLMHVQTSEFIFDALSVLTQRIQVVAGRHSTALNCILLGGRDGSALMPTPLRFMA